MWKIQSLELLGVRKASCRPLSSQSHRGSQSLDLSDQSWGRFGMLQFQALEDSKVQWKRQEPVEGYQHCKLIKANQCRVKKRKCMFSQEKEKCMLREETCYIKDSQDKENSASMRSSRWHFTIDGLEGGDEDIGETETADHRMEPAPWVMICLSQSHQTVSCEHQSAWSGKNAILTKLNLDRDFQKGSDAVESHTWKAGYRQ